MVKKLRISERKSNHINKRRVNEALSRYFNRIELSDPEDWLYVNWYGDRNKFMTYDEMLADAKENYDWGDETNISTYTEVIPDGYIPVDAKYKNAEFISRFGGKRYTYAEAVIDYERGQGEYPNFDDREWFDYTYECINEGESEYYFYDEIVETNEFQTALYNAMLNDDELLAEFNESDQTDYTFEDICESIAYEPDEIHLLRSRVSGSAFYRIMGYRVDADDIYDSFRSYL